MAKDDGGFRSRKWWAFVLTSGLILLSGVIMAADKVNMVGFSLVTALGLYLGGNVSRDWVLSKGNQAFPPAPPSPPSPPSPVIVAVNPPAKVETTNSHSEEEGS